MMVFIRPAFVVTVCCLCISPSAARQEPLRTLTVHVTVRDHQGRPISTVGLSAKLRVPNGSRYVGSSHPPFTDDNGQAAVEAVVPASAASIDIQAVAAVPQPPRASTTRDAVLRHNQLKRLHSFESSYPVPLVAGQDHYSLTISTKPAITISGRLVDADGQPFSSGTIKARSCECTSFSKRDGPAVGTFELIGVPRGEPAQVIIINDGRVGRFLQLSAEQTQTDLNLGDIVLQPIVGASKARLQAEENPPLPGRSRMYTVVSENAETIITVMVDNSDGSALTPWLEAGQGWLPPGRYYVIPNSIGFGGDDSGWLLLDLIRAGRAAARSELPSFTAVANEEVAVTIDPVEVTTKIRAAAQAEGVAAE